MKKQKKTLNKIAFIFALLFTTVTFVQASTLTISPETANLNKGETLTATIYINTEGEDTDGVDIELIYNPQVIEIQDTDTSKEGIQIQQGSLYPITILNKTEAGYIKFSQLSTGGNSFNGAGALATITFKAISNGSSPLEFDFTLGESTDSNVAGAGRDLLMSVEGGKYTVGGGISGRLIIVALLLFLVVTIIRKKKRKV